MVLHVARALHVLGLEAFAAELAEHGGQGLADDVDQRVEPAAMRHADGDLVRASRGGGFDDGVHRRDRDLATFEPEPFGGDVATLAERLEPLGLGELAEDAALGLGIEAVGPRRPFDLALDPGLLFGILDVHEFDADMAAIGLTKDGHNLAQCRGLAAQHVVDEDQPVEVGLGEAIGGGVKLRVRRRHLQTERVKPRLQMPAHAIAADQHERAQARDDGGAEIAGRGRGRLARRGTRRPGSAGRLLQHGAGVFVQGAEQLAEARIDRAGVGGPAGIEVAQERGVRAAEGRGQDIHASHRGCSLCAVPSPTGSCRAAPLDRASVLLTRVWQRTG